MKRAIVVLWSMLLAGCYHYHSVPADPAYDHSANVIPEAIRLFSDRHGTIYPAEWKQLVDMPAFEKKPSLRIGAKAAGKLPMLEEAERRILQEVREMAARKERVFILVHGFNDPAASAAEAYKVVEGSVVFKSTDGIIQFYWDGLVAGPAAPQRIWFEAAGTSQIAGSRALRAVLNEISGKQVVIVSFSRGASVVLSALSDPPFDPARLSQERDEGALQDAPLRKDDDTIDVVLLAPAIGRVDFETALRTSGDATFRDLPGVRSLHHTVNEDDDALKKGLGLPRIAAGFNPTDLGWRPDLSRQLAGRYPFLKAHCMRGINHNYPKYAAHPVFRQMLREIPGMVVTPETLPPAPCTFAS